MLARIVRALLNKALSEFLVRDSERVFEETVGKHIS